MDVRKIIPSDGNRIDVNKVFANLDWDNVTEFERLVLGHFPIDNRRLIAEVKADPEFARLSWHDGETILHHAAGESELRLAKILIERCAAIDAMSASLGTPLLYAAEYNQTEMVKLLLKSGASTSHVTRANRNAMHYAALWNNDEVALALLEQNVPLDVVDNNGYTALDISAVKRFPSMTRLLVKAGTSSQKKRARVYILELSNENGELDLN